MACQDCGEPDARSWLGDVLVCDRCFDRRIAEHTGFPRLPEPPPMEVIGPDDRHHRFRFRIWRAPTGIEVQLEEMGVAVGEGYEFAVLGDHDADVDVLVEHVRRQAEAEVGRLYLERCHHHGEWVLADEEVAGRLVWDDEGSAGRPYRVVVDGRTLSWEELGMALESYEGWNFRLMIEDRIHDARGDAEVIELRGQRGGGG